MTPRLPPSMARDANVATPAASQGAPPPSPYASPWAGGNTAGSPSAPMPPRPYPQPPHGAPPVSSAAAGSSGQYGVLYPTSAPPAHNGHANPSPYGGPYAGAGASPYAAAPNRPYAASPYTPQGYPQSGHPARPQGPSPQNGPPTGPPSQSPAPPAQPPSQPQPSQGSVANLVVPHIEITPELQSRYPPNIDHGVIRNLEVFRFQYNKIRNDPEEATKIDKVIRAFADTSVSKSTLNELEQQLWDSFRRVPNLRDYRPDATTEPPAPSSAADADAAVIAAAGAASTLTNAPPSTQQPQAPQQTQQSTPQQTLQQGYTHAHLQAPPQASQQTNLSSASSPATPAPTGAGATKPGDSASEPHRFTPNMTIASTSVPSAPVAPVASLPPSHRPSVEPLTPVPGSPAVQTGTPLVKRSITEITADDLTAKKDNEATEDDKTPQQTE